MKRDIRLPTAPVSGAVEEAFAEVQQSFERLCLAAGMEARTALIAHQDHIAEKPVAPASRAA